MDSAAAFFVEPNPLDELSESRRKILRFVKKQSAASISEVARALAVTHEAARKQIVDLQRSGWLTTTCAEDEDESDPLGGAA